MCAVIILITFLNLLCFNASLSIHLRVRCCMQYFECVCGKSTILVIFNFFVGLLLQLRKQLIELKRRQIILSTRGRAKLDLIVKFHKLIHNCVYKRKDFDFTQRLSSIIYNN